MTWREILLSRHQESSREASGEADTSATADVLLQIVLPIVLILAFFVLQSARDFESRIAMSRTDAAAAERLRQAKEELDREKASLDKEREGLAQQSREIEAAQHQLGEQQSKLDEQVGRLAAWWAGIGGTEKGRLAEELSEALLEIQKQRIVAALEQVEAEYRQSLGLSFLLRKEIRLTPEGRLVSDHQTFQQACQATVQALRSEESRNAERQRLFRRVLQISGLTDDGAGAVETPVSGTLTTQEALRAGSGRITAENRRFLDERLAQLQAELRQEVLRFGRQVIGAALDHYRSAPLDELYRRNPEILKLKEQIVTASRTGQDPTPYE
jgi:hypothetical protein